MVQSKEYIRYLTLVIQHHYLESLAAEQHLLPNHCLGLRARGHFHLPNQDETQRFEEYLPSLASLYQPQSCLQSTQGRYPMLPQKSPHQKQWSTLLSLWELQDYPRSENTH